MTTRPRSHPGFDALVDCVVRELDGHGITLTPLLVHDELRAMLRLPESAGGLPESERLDLLGPQARRRLADRLRARLRLPDLASGPSAPGPSAPGPTAPDPDAEPEREPCQVVELAERRHRDR
ncbi:hypothetical protein ASG49_17490 [Marmoricola sp. Leaf446]|uniref:hypothetical protein n=1 Tax=Marmoricola sp. Leaf446 TaxID=1736379 RepID=UPI0006F930EB|nr:hypothetical protein [Marmoricola sp. Leaf446]KQT89527.1 hypothetical protein ASG49_17490 [Marmoricola sp. Leaf446]